MARHTDHRMLPCLLLCIALSGMAKPAPMAEPGNTVRISVLSLFHPAELRLTAASGCSLTLQAASLDRSNPIPKQAQTLTIRLQSAQLLLQTPTQTEPASAVSLAAIPDCPAQSPPASFWLEVPDKLRRSYQGTLTIRPKANALEAVVAMPLEIAVASVVAAESLPADPIEAMKAQAVAARSFLAASQTGHLAGHIGFDFCDTTHCQFLRSPPSPHSPAAQAARATQGLILTWHDPATAQDVPLAAMYARSCGGRTRTLSEIGLPVSGYPYYAVHCRFCAHHPELWQRSSPAVATERDRLLYNRVHGWSALPSVPQKGDPSPSPHATVHGRGIGHGLGLCQLGAADMARHHATFPQILSHYYPNTQLQPIPPAADSSNIR